MPHEASNHLSLTASNIEVGRGELSTFDQASSREWLVTNGLGGYAAGTVGEANTRRYHGLLVAALAPPLGRVVMVAKLDVIACYAGREYALTSNEFADGSISPHGYQHIERFRLECGLPVWEYAFSDVLIEKRLLMPHGENTTLVQYRVLRASAAVTLMLRPLCTYRDYHGHTQGGWSMGCETLDNGFRIAAHEGAQPYEIRATGAREVAETPEWYWRFHHRMEASRGLDDSEDLFGPGGIRAELSAGEATSIVISSETSASMDFEVAHEKEIARRQSILDGVDRQTLPAWVQQLVLAADQFVVARTSENEATGKTVIAGYPWFGDWGRDTMIALPGLTLTTGRLDVAADILRTFAKHINQGMLPNRFPDIGAEPEYNTVDATLWYIHAIRMYTLSSQDNKLVEHLFDRLLDIVDWHRKGTHYNIQVDLKDGLLAAGEEGVQLTWMDAKVGDWVVTPRIGKCVEINALWFNALSSIADLATRLGRSEVAADYQRQAAIVFNSFQRFWSDELGYLHDVIDGPEGALGADDNRYDSALRPNQIFSVSLPFSPLSDERQRAVVDACARELVTSYGLRSLASGDENYVAHYGGGPLERDGAYHQGTAWGWLLAPFAEAHFRVYGDAEQAKSFLRPMSDHLRDVCVGSISEIFDAAPPHSARGCFAQAWSVSETLRVWVELST